MSLDANDKIAALASQNMLVELNEPEAWLEALRRIADRRASELAQGATGEAKRWRALAGAILDVQAKLAQDETAQSARDKQAKPTSDC